MYGYKDKTFCQSPHCKNDCGRQLTKEIQEGAQKAGMPLSLGYFCDLPERLTSIAQEKSQESSKT